MSGSLVSNRSTNNLVNTEDYGTDGSIRGAPELRTAKRAYRANNDVNSYARETQSHNYPAPQVPSVEDRKAQLAQRRRSSALQKTPAGPRPLQPSISKRAPSESTPAYFQNNVSEPFLGLSARAPSSAAQRIASRSHTPHDPSSRTLSSPLVDFDAVQDIAKMPMHTSSRDLDLAETGKARGASSRKSMVLPSTAGVNSSEQSFRSSAMPPPAAITNHAGNLHNRQRSAALRAAQLSSSAANNHAAPAAPVSLRTRRQSQFPSQGSSSSLMSNESRAPRKSIGPGSLVADQPGDRTSRNFGSSIASLNEGGVALPREPIRAKPRPSLSSNLTLNKDSAIDGNLVDRRTKAMSMQPATRMRAGSTGPPKSGLPSYASDTFASAMAKPNVMKAPSPVPAARKRPNTPGHLSGLGARTVSPTDARRMKRMSTHPPLTQRSPTPDAMPNSRPVITPPPPMPQRKSMTPVSARATPINSDRLDTARSAASSRSSYTSCRPFSSSMGQGPQAAFASSTRNLHSASGAAEHVPPVPKIPLAYESPSESHDKPFFADVGSTAAALRERTPRSSISTDSRGNSRDLGPLASSITAQPARQSRRLTFTSRTDASKQGQAGSSTKLGQTAPRLPPLNLQPLSHPTETKLASIANRASMVNPGKMTPPPKRNAAKTPTTPMTASKVSFPDREQVFGKDIGTLANIRSSTSHNASRTSFQAPSRGVSPETTSSRTGTPRQTRSPASGLLRSRSRSKSKQELNSARSRSRDKLSTSVKNDAPAGSTGLIGRLSRAASKSKRGETITTTETDPPTQPSVRRKMSLGWRRSSSKNALSRVNTNEDPQSATAASEAEPPRLPSLANTSNTHLPSPRISLSSDSTKIPSLRSTGTESVSSASQNNITKSTRSNGANQEPTPATMRATPSFLTPMQRILGPRSTSGSKANSVSPAPDSDAAADEEMRKLASKKKEFELAAKTVDELTRRAIAREGISANQATRTIPLTLFERGEIIDYRDIYFTGIKSADKIKGDMSAQNNNFGFDDERGDYQIVHGDHLSYRYEVVDTLGKGSFGQVVRCVDHKLGKLVAIKIIRNKKRFHQQALVEVNILQKLKEWDPEMKHSMINFTQSFYFRGHLCIATELLGINLYEFIKAHDFRGFSLKLIRRFARQMLSSLALLQTKNVIHCDLKPENILLAHPLQSEIKVIDFGSSCFEHEKVYTYIQSRFYRSPEVILGMSYGMPIDMWSFGCILAELFTGYPIFPGENEQEQLACIMEIFGPPEKHLIEKSTRRKLFFDSLGKPRVTTSSKGKRRRPSSKTLQQALKCDDEGFLDFLAKCLRWDPDRRMKPDEAANHEFVTGMKKPNKPRSQLGPTVRGTSPAKRAMVGQTPMAARTLPEAPVTALKSVAPSITNRDVIGSSPLKASNTTSNINRRHSTMVNAQANMGFKRQSNGAALGSGLGRGGLAAGRSISGRPDLASAAAAVSLGAQRQR